MKKRHDIIPLHYEKETSGDTVYIRNSKIGQMMITAAKNCTEAELDETVRIIETFNNKQPSLLEQERLQE